MDRVGCRRDEAERALRRDIKARQRELKQQGDETTAATVTRIVRLVLEVAEENAPEFLWWTPRLDMDTEPVDVERLYPMRREADGTWTRRYLGLGPKHGEEPRYRVKSRPQQRQDATGAWVSTDSHEWFIEVYDVDSGSWTTSLRVAAKDAVEAERWLVGDGRDFFGLARPAAWRPTRPRRTAHALREPIGRTLRGDMGKAGKDGRYAYLAYALLGFLLDLTPLQIRTLLDNRRRPRHRPKP